MPQLIRSAGGQRTVIPIGTKRPSEIMREDIVEALRGLTIKFELKISDVIDADDVASCSDTQDKSDRQSDVSKDEVTSSAVPTSNGHSVKVASPVGQLLTNGIAAAVQGMNDITIDYRPPKEEPKTVVDDTVRSTEETEPPIVPKPVETRPQFVGSKLVVTKPPEETPAPPKPQESVKIENNQEVLHPNMRPKLVNEFRSNIRPVSTLRTDPELFRAPATLNFTPMQVLKKQAENHIVKPPTRNGNGRPVFVDPIGANLIANRPTAIKSPTPPRPASHDKEPAQTNGIPNPQPTATKTIESPAAKPDDSASRQIKEEKTISNPVPIVTQPTAEPTKESVMPAITWGKATVGSTIQTCLLSEDSSVNPPAIYITYDSAKILEVTNMLSDLATEIEILPKLRSVNAHDVVFGKSAEDEAWYRATVKEVKGSKVDVLYVDWGSTETLDLDRVRYLSDSRLSLASKPACAIKVKFTNETSDELFSSGFKVKVEDYDEFDGIYTVTVVN